MGSFNGYDQSYGMEEKKGGGAVQKILLGGVASLLLIGIVIGVVEGVAHSSARIGSEDDKDSPSDISTSMKAVTTICAPTDYKETCMKTLEPGADGKKSVNLKELIKLAFTATIKEMDSAFNLSSHISNKTDDPMQKMALSDCKDLFEYAAAELQASFSEVGDKEMHTLPDRVDEIKNWLSAVISYQETCTDGITKPALKSAMKDGLLNATQLTSNALAIISEISSILSTFKIPFNVSSLARGPREEENGEQAVNADAYPSWFSTGDRKLLAYHDNNNLKPDVVVAKDGSGNCKSINDALKAMTKKRTGRYVIYVKAGVYTETVEVTKDMENVFMYGDGPRKTTVTGRKNFIDGTPTFQTATFAAIGNGFIAKSMGFCNTAGPEKHQAVALRVQSDMSAFINCRMAAYQDTLYAQTHRQFYRNCVISGTVDFIFGDSASVFQNCLIIVRKPMDNQQNIVTAHGRTDRRESTGFVIQNCRIAPEMKLYPTRFTTKSYLGRPWKEYSRTVIMESLIEDFIQPNGWMPWDGDFALKTLYYAEFGNRGAGSRTDKRVKWPGYKVITNKREALQFTPAIFIQGNQWLKNTGAPVFLGFKNN